MVVVCMSIDVNRIHNVDFNLTHYSIVAITCTCQIENSHQLTLYVCSRSCFTLIFFAQKCECARARFFFHIIHVIPFQFHFSSTCCFWWLWTRYNSVNVHWVYLCECFLLTMIHCMDKSLRTEHMWDIVRIAYANWTCVRARAHTLSWSKKIFNIIYSTNTTKTKYAYLHELLHQNVWPLWVWLNILQLQINIYSASLNCGWLK